SPPVELKPATQEFGAIPVPPSAVHGVGTFVISKAGAAEVGPIAVSLRGADAQHFQIGEDHCAQGIHATPSCVVVVQLQPSTAGPKTATVVALAAGLELTAEIRGRGVEPPKVVLSPSSRSFEAVPVGLGSPPFVFMVKSTVGSGAGIGTPNVTIDGPDAIDF